jgi:hypothetical protein
MRGLERFQKRAMSPFVSIKLSLSPKKLPLSLSKCFMYNAAVRGAFLSDPLDGVVGFIVSGFA